MSCVAANSVDPAVENIGAAWERGHLGAALAYSTLVTAMTVAMVLRCPLREPFASPSCDHRAARCCSCWCLPR